MEVVTVVMMVGVLKVVMEVMVGMVKDVVKQERRRWDVTAVTSSSGDEWCL